MSKIILGFPGLCLEEEQGRLERIAGAFPDFEFRRFNYPGIKKVNGSIYVPFSIEDFSQNVEIPEDYDELGILASSTGAKILEHYLEKKGPVKIDWYVAISPFFRANPEVVPQIEYLKESEQDLDISSEYDRASGIRRIIPNDYLENVLNLAEFSPSQEIPEVLTMLGKRDKMIDRDLAISNHYGLGGEERNLRFFNAGHGLNPGSAQIAMNFIRSLQN